MPTTSTNQALYDAFLDLAYADQEIVDAEFEELIAASWEPPPPAPPARPEPADRPPHTGSLRATDPPGPGRSTRPRTRPARQRSPPVRAKEGTCEGR
jgi:hypothetical protein